MADPIHEATGRTPFPPATTVSVPESFEPNDPGWPEILPTGGGFTDDAVADYLRRLRRYDLLTADQEVERAQDIEAGLFAEHLLAAGAALPGQDVAELRTIVLLGRRAADGLFHANLRLVVSIAKHYTRRGLDFQDLIQEGNLGLYRAVRTFDFTKGFRFSSHATWQIRSGITQALANQSRLIRLPANVIDQLRKVRSAQRTAAMTGAICSSEDLSQLMDTSIGKIECLLTLDQPVCSLDARVPDGKGGTEAVAEKLWDSYYPDAADALFHQQLKAQLHSVLGTLEDREARVIAMRFGLTGGEAKTLDAVAKSCGMTRDRIRQIEVAAMAKLRHPSRSNILRQYHLVCEGPPGGEAAWSPRRRIPSSAAPATAATPQTPPRRVPA
ncbi:sigma-70 family RNA polymerase sigma factor [Arthrobacter sp. UYEF36]|uniref:sigma-70 family RNA polymerase sigma factor n=1 Tax=Arthrobacter sp. UYEF36 TaxID=1756366 RepID=UPI003391912B